MPAEKKNQEDWIKALRLLISIASVFFVLAANEEDTTEETTPRQQQQQQQPQQQQPRQKTPQPAEAKAADDAEEEVEEEERSSGRPTEAVNFYAQPKVSIGDYLSCPEDGSYFFLNRVLPHYAPLSTFISNFFAFWPHSPIVLMS